MKLTRLLPPLLAALLLFGCSPEPPASTATPSPLPSPTATVTPGDGPALERAADALDGLIPAGMTLIQKRQGNTLTRLLKPAKGDGSILLPDLTLSDGQWAGDLTPAALLDASFMADAVVLSDAGMAVDAARYASTATKLDMLEGLIAAVRASGYTLDASGIDSAIETPALRQALEMDLEYYWSDLSTYEDELMEFPMSVYEQLDYTALFVRFMESRVLAGAGRAATQDDAVALYLLVTGEEAPFAGGGQPLTRLELARVFMDAYSERHPADEVPADWLDMLSYMDIDSDLLPEIQRIEYYQVMLSYPSYNLFSPELTVWLDHLPELISQFYIVYRDGMMMFSDTGDSEDALETASPFTEQPSGVYETMVSYPEALARCAALAVHYDSLASALPVEQVLNLPETSIYISQNDGSEYASVNCMPTILAMALKWRDASSPVTPDDLRRHYPEITGGWNMLLIEEQLNEHGVPYEILAATRENLLSALDAGNIILSQFSTADLQSDGHCFLLVGYRRQGDALWFCAEDPDSIGEGKYGRPDNDQIWLEAEETLWTINRFNGMVTVVGPADNPDSPE